MSDFYQKRQSDLPADLFVPRSDLAAEVERLRGELRGMTVARDAAGVFMRDAEKQRDALADAILLGKDGQGHFDDCPRGAPGGEKCSAFCRACVTALRKVGRLP